MAEDRVWLTTMGWNILSSWLLSVSFVLDMFPSTLRWDTKIHFHRAHSLRSKHYLSPRPPLSLIFQSRHLLSRESIPIPPTCWTVRKNCSKTVPELEKKEGIYQLISFYIFPTGPKFPALKVASFFPFDTLSRCQIPCPVVWVSSKCRSTEGARNSRCAWLVGQETWQWQKKRT